MTTPASLSRVRGALVFAAAVTVLVSCGKARVSATAQHDDVGRSVNVPSRVTRVVTLAPNLTEIVFAIGAGQTIVGTDDFSNFPAAAHSLPKVGGMQPNIEKIVQLRPDLVLASTEGNHPNLARALDAAHIPLFVVRTDRLTEIAPAMTRIGSLLGVPATAAVNALEAGIAAQKRTRPAPARVLFAVWTDPLYVAGGETYLDDLYALTGARNAVSVEGWPQYSLESFVAAPPDIVLYPGRSVTEQQVQALFNRAPGVHARAVPVDEDIFQRPGPRVVEAAKVLNSVLDGQL